MGAIMAVCPDQGGCWAYPYQCLIYVTGYSRSGIAGELRNCGPRFGPGIGHTEALWLYLRSLAG